LFVKANEFIKYMSKLDSLIMTWRKKITFTYGRWSA